MGKMKRKGKGGWGGRREMGGEKESHRKRRGSLATFRFALIQLRPLGHHSGLADHQYYALLSPFNSPSIDSP